MLIKKKISIKNKIDNIFEKVSPSQKNLVCKLGKNFKEEIILKENNKNILKNTRNRFSKKYICPDLYFNDSTSGNNETDNNLSKVEIKNYLDEDKIHLLDAHKELLTISHRKNNSVNSANFKSEINTRYSSYSKNRTSTNFTLSINKNDKLLSEKKKSDDKSFFMKNLNEFSINNHNVNYNNNVKINKNNLIIDDKLIITNNFIKTNNHNNFKNSILCTIKNRTNSKYNLINISKANSNSASKIAMNNLNLINIKNDNQKEINIENNKNPREDIKTSKHLYSEKKIQSGNSESGNRGIHSIKIKNEKGNNGNNLNVQTRNLFSDVSIKTPIRDCILNFKNASNEVYFFFDEDKKTDRNSKTKRTNSNFFRTSFFNLPLITSLNSINAFNTLNVNSSKL